MDFRVEKCYTDHVESVVVEMIRKDRIPFWTALRCRLLPYLYSLMDQADRAIRVKCAKPQKDDFDIVVSTEKFDLIGMTEA